jgi:asparagine synthetase B (glutamine-hydrolysing)
VATCCEEVFQRLFTVSEGEDPLNSVLYAGCKTFLPDLNLNVADKLSMASFVEIRVPFLDNEVIVSDKETFGYSLDSKGTKLITGSTDNGSPQRYPAVLTASRQLARAARL